MFGLAKKLVGKVAGKVVGNAKNSLKSSPVASGIKAFKSWKDKKAETSKPRVGTPMPAPKQVGEFSTGIDTNLKIPKIGSWDKQKEDGLF